MDKEPLLHNYFKTKVLYGLIIPRPHESSGTQNLFHPREWSVHVPVVNISRNAGLPPLNVLSDGTQHCCLQGLFHQCQFSPALSSTQRFLSPNFSFRLMIKNLLVPFCTVSSGTSPICYYTCVQIFSPHVLKWALVLNWITWLVTRPHTKVFIISFWKYFRKEGVYQGLGGKIQM